MYGFVLKWSMRVYWLAFNLLPGFGFVRRNGLGKTNTTSARER